MKRLTVFFLLLFILLPNVLSQRADVSKMSPLVRQVMMEEASVGMQKRLKRNETRSICAFLRVNGDAKKILSAHGCHVFAQYGNIYIAEIPIHRLGPLSSLSEVSRIEAGRSCSALMDSVAIQIDALPAYAGTLLPQAYTGEGVVMGIEDVGFDLTHPNFYNSSLTDYRIKCLWDQLSTDTVGSRLVVGADYTSREALLSYAHSRDASIISHGTHTLGCAAGSGYNSKYRGIAYQSDICLVNNAVTENAKLIDSTNIYKYTSATDVLGFKYIFDYATKVGKPCVISFSEGYHPDFSDDDMLMSEVMDSITGPGRIIVSSAGNEGFLPTYFHKPAGVASAGTYISSDDKYAYLTMKSEAPFSIRTVAYVNAQSPDTVLIPTEKILSCPDSQYVDTVSLSGNRYIFNISAYPSCYHQSETAYLYYIKVDNGNKYLGATIPVSVEVLGKDADVGAFKYFCYMLNGTNHHLDDAEKCYSVNMPSCLPSVISVGATGYRNSIVNYRGEKCMADCHYDGQRADFSSIGPSLDGRIKPDVMAPGEAIISSYGSYYLEANPNADDISYDVEHFQFGGRTYAWNCNSGTSMSSPIVGGAVALWLQAKPNLTPQDILGILSRTCSHYDKSLSYPNNYYGYGQIDVYRGLFDILGIDGIQGLSSSQLTSVHVFPRHDGNVCLQFDNPPLVPFDVRIYSTSGTLLITKKYAPSQLEYVLDASGIPSGVYAVQVSGDRNRAAGSTLIRK